MRVRGYADGTPCWVTLRTTDITSSAAFYAGLFDWEYSDGIFRRNGWATAGVVPDTSSDHPPGWLTYVSTQDIERTVAAVGMAGGTVLRQPAQAPPGGTMSLCADPGGAVFGCWQRQSFAGAQLINEPGTMLWSEVAARDEEIAEAFYGKVFGWSGRPGVGGPPGYRYTDWSVGGRVVAGMVGMGATFPAGAPPQWRTMFEVDGVDEAVRRCRELGGRVLSGPVAVGVGRYTRVQDPQGFAFGVVDLLPELRDRL